MAHYLQHTLYPARCADADARVLLCRHLEWRSFWLGHASGMFVLDYEERVVFGVLYMAVMGLLCYEACRRFVGLW